MSILNLSIHKWCCVLRSNCYKKLKVPKEHNSWNYDLLFRSKKHKRTGTTTKLLPSAEVSCLKNLIWNSDSFLNKMFFCFSFLFSISTIFFHFLFFSKNIFIFLKIIWTYIWTHMNNIRTHIKIILKCMNFFKTNVFFLCSERFINMIWTFILYTWSLFSFISWTLF